ncbi:dTMP kinase [Candidatus Woesearchaeota archaeon]|nr:MAG: dTMP kinase [Candidatus Woesearchaeota archaeon]
MVLLVIDGPDGSGKSTQVKYLVTRLQNEGKKVELIKFPQYGKASAYFVENYLNGQYGSSDEVPAELASMFYMLDRFDASRDIKKKLDKGKIIILDRYVSSNMAHQGGKFLDDEKREKFLSWLEWLEFDLAKIPKPDKVIYLHVPIKKTHDLIDTRNLKKDIHEQDKNHLSNSQKVYLDLAEKKDYFTKIICTNESGEMRTVREINDDIYSELLKLL